jgi:hypothetical protein
MILDGSSRGIGDLIASVHRRAPASALACPANLLMSRILSLVALFRAVDDAKL